MAGLTTRLAVVSKKESTHFGEIEFSSDGEYDDDTATFRYKIDNQASQDANIEWDPVTNRIVGRETHWESKSVYSLKGLFDALLNKPLSSKSKAKVSTVGGTSVVEDVPTYLTSGTSWSAVITKIPKAVVKGVTFVVKHYIGGNSPGVLLTAQATLIDESLYHYRYTATAEGEVAYLVKWGHLFTVVEVKEPGAEVVIADFQATGLVGLTNEFVMMTRPDGKRSTTADTLAPMPFPQLFGEVRSLRELSQLTDVYSTQGLSI